MKRTTYISLAISMILIGPAFVHAAQTGYVWTEQTAAGSHGWAEVTFSANGTVLAGAAHSTNDYIYVSTTTGATWAPALGAGYRNWYGLAGSSDGSVLAGVANSVGTTTGDIYVSTDTGATWTDESSAGSHWWVAITSSSNGSVLAAAYNNSGSIVVSTTTGATWTTEASAGSRNWSALAASADGSVIAATVDGSHVFGPAGDIYVSTTTGATWTDETSAGAHNWTGVAVSSDGTRQVAVDSNGDIYVSTTTGATWNAAVSASAHSWSSVTSSSNGLVLAAAATDGTVEISSDGGTTWSSLGSLNPSPTDSWASIKTYDGERLALASSNGDIWMGVLDTTPPTVSLTVPTASQAASGQLTLAATASDNVQVAGVTFYVDGAAVGSEVSSSPYQMTLDTSTLSNGTHTAYAVAHDENGTDATSASVSFTVNNEVNRGGGSSVTEQVHNLITMGNTALANQIQQQWPTLFSSSTPVLTSVPMPTASSTMLAVRDLEQGIRGEDVTLLQNLLIKADKGPAAAALARVGATGYFGSYTASALGEFQKFVGIQPAAGYFGPLTRAYLKTANLAGLWW